MARTRIRPVVVPAVLISAATLVAACFPDATTNEQLPGFDAGGISLDGTTFDDGATTDDAGTRCELTLCNLVCVDITQDIHNCGRCGHDCTKLPGVVASDVSCVGGVCNFDHACAPGKEHCGSTEDTGCDTDITTASHCGACDVSCIEPTPLCSPETADGGDAGNDGGNGAYACTAVVCGAGYTVSGTLCLPTIDITAPVATATDGGATTATFHVSRGLATTGDLVVKLGVDASSSVTTTATAAIPVDYVLSGGSVTQTGTSITVTIPDGQNGVDITMTPTANTHAEAAEALVLDVTSDASYLVGSAMNATAVIAAHGLDVVVTTDSTSSYALLEGSIRQALTNAEAFGGGTINVASGASGTVTLVGGLPLIDQNVDIVGPSGLLTLNGDGTFRIVEMRGTGTWSFLGFTNGSDPAIGGAILDRGNLTLDNVTLSASSASRGAAVEIFATGTTPSLVMTSCTVTNNLGAGAAIDNAGTLTITGSTFSGNAGGNVSGAYTNGGGNTPATP